MDEKYKYDFGWPTRSGEASGPAVEKKMLGKTPDVESCCTKLQPLNTTTLITLRTKGGHPRFYTETTPEEDEEEEVNKLYMESGELTYGYAAPESPTRGAPAKWRFNSIDPAGFWLGLIYTSITPGAQNPPHPNPIDGVLIDDMDSVAIGYERFADPYEDDVEAAALLDVIVRKKNTAAWFPPSLFTGKLRLFMQAQYGALNKNFYFEYDDSSGYNAYLDYTPPIGAPFRFGFSASNTTGLFTATDYRYYIVEIVGVGSETVAIYVMPLDLSAEGDALRDAMIEGGVDDIDKAEAYLLANASIRTDRRVSIGTVNIGSSDVGDALAYGWKFNQNGTKANIVRLGIVGSGLSHDGRSQESYITIERSAVFDGNESGKWSIDCTYSGLMAWLDGWGEFNIFAPLNETSTTLLSYSIRRAYQTVALYEFTNVPLYGYFDANDTWVTANIGWVANAPGYYTSEAPGMSISPGRAAQFAEHTPTPPTPAINQYCNRNTTSVGKCITKWVESRSEWMLTIDGTLRTGYKAGTWYTVTEFYPGVLGSFSTEEYAGVGLGWWYCPANYHQPTDPSGGQVEAIVAGMDGTHILDGDSWRVAWMDGNIMVYSAFNTTDTTAWTLVIPSGDCEAIMRATYNHSTEPSYTVGPTATSGSVRSSWIQKIVERKPDGSEPQYVTYTFNVDWSYSYTDYDDDWSTPSGLPPGYEHPAYHGETSILLWSKTKKELEGTPSTSYTTLFTVDRDSPVFNGAITFRESYGGEYYGSEGYNSGGVLSRSLFVGWY